MKNIEIVYKNVTELKAAEYNPRKISAAQIEHLKKSLSSFDCVEPIVVNTFKGREGVIIGGHQRFKIMQSLGESEVPCIEIAIPLEKEKELNIRLNKNTGDFDFDMLEEHFEIDDLLEWGFEEGELDFEVEQVEGLCDEDEVPETPAQPVTILGDIWLLGDHRLMCGDSTSVDAVEKLMGGQAPNIMITDPPYGVKYEADWRANAKGRVKTAREENSNLMNDERADWYDSYVLFPGNVAYVWHASAFTDVVMDGLRRAGFDIKQQIIWNKNVHALSRSDYHWKHEPCWYAVKPKGERNWKGGRTQMTVWDIPSIVFEKDKTAHPTQKPVEIYTKALEHHTNQGEYVYDPFGGSGTLIMACEKLQRRGISMEFDPKYCDVIINRWEKFTGKKAVHEKTGKSFEEAGLLANSV